jgi:hypothetical protein
MSIADVLSDSVQAMRDYFDDEDLYVAPDHRREIIRLMAKMQGLQRKLDRQCPEYGPWLKLQFAKVENSNGSQDRAQRG